MGVPSSERPAWERVLDWAPVLFRLLLIVELAVLALVIYLVARPGASVPIRVYEVVETFIPYPTGPHRDGVDEETEWRQKEYVYRNLSRREQDDGDVIYVQELPDRIVYSKLDWILCRVARDTRPKNRYASTLRMVETLLGTQPPTMKATKREVVLHGHKCTLTEIKPVKPHVSRWEDPDDYVLFRDTQLLIWRRPGDDPARPVRLEMRVDGETWICERNLVRSRLMYPLKRLSPPLLAWRHPWNLEDDLRTIDDEYEDVQDWTSINSGWPFWSKERLATTHFRIFAPDMVPRRQVVNVARWAEDAYRTRGLLLDCYPADKIEVFVTPDTERSDGAKYDSYALPWYGWITLGEKSRQAVMHEYLHMLVYRITGRWDLGWLDEGIACCLDEKPAVMEEKRRTAAWLASRRESKVPSISEASDELSGTEVYDKEAEMAYTVAYISVQYLLDECGSEKLRSFLVALRTEDEEKAFKHTYGFELDSLSTRAQEYYLKK